MEIRSLPGFGASCPFCGARAPRFDSDPRCPHFRGKRYGGLEVVYVFEPQPPQPEPAPEPKPQGPEVVEVKVLHYHREGHISMKALGSKNPSSGSWVVDKYFVATQEEAELLEAPAFSFKQRVLAGLELAGQKADPEQVEDWLARGEEGLLSDEEDERLRALAALAAEKLGLRVVPLFEKAQEEPEGWVELPFRPEKKLIRRLK